MRAAAALSTDHDSGHAAELAAKEAVHRLGAAPALALVFASPHHARAAGDVLAAIREVADVPLIGCVGESVVEGSREVEDEPAVAVWLSAHEGGVQTYQMEFLRTESGGALAGWQFDPGAGGVHLMIADPFTFPADLLLRHLNENAPGVVVVGGMASGAEALGDTRLFHDDRVRSSGAVGMHLTGIEVRTLVSQGCRPVGAPFTVTEATGRLIQGLGGKPPLERLQEIVAALDPQERQLLARGVQVGRVIDPYRETFERGDFLIRGVAGVDPETGGMLVGEEVEVGETLQFHVRDAASADEDLRELLHDALRDLGDRRPTAALLFTCNGRGSRLFAEPDHDASLVSGALGQAPLAGFFCAGELGPVGGRNFLHGFTASLALFLGDPQDEPAQDPVTASTTTSSSDEPR